MALNLNFPQGRIGRLGLISLVLFILTIPLGNWVVTNVGLVCDPHGPCLIPVWPGVWSPSAVMVAGLLRAEGIDVLALPKDWFEPMN